MDKDAILKKIAAILLIAILLFNMAGYKFLFRYLEKDADYRLEKRIDAGQYDESQLIEMSFVLQLPYYNESAYETCYGEITFNGQHYRFVKRKVSGNKLYFLCLPNTDKNNIESAKKDFVKAVNDIPNNNVPQNQSKASFMKLIMSEFLQDERTMDFTLQLVAYRNLLVPDCYLISQFEPETAAQPPDSLS